MVVLGVGTGGTISGIAKRLKEDIPDIVIVGADPYGSILGGGGKNYPYKVDGIGYDFFPDVLLFFQFFSDFFLIFCFFCIFFFFVSFSTRILRVDMLLFRPMFRGPKHSKIECEISKNAIL